MTIQELQAQRRWVLWKLTQKPGQPKPTKVPYQPNGRMAKSNAPETWHTFAECGAVVSQFSGIGMVLGEVDGVWVWGVDIDNCCDAVSGKFSAESREIVIGLDSYGEYSPSGEGCHVFGIGCLPGDGSPIVKPFPGCKQIEIKGRGYYFTFSQRHLSKTPGELMDRQKQLEALCQRVQACERSGLTVAVPKDEDERFKKLWAGDLSDYDENHSRGDMALVQILARRFNNNPFLIDAEFCKSGLYREKWDRLDYKWSTIAKVIKDEPVFDTEEPMDEDSPTEYLVEAASESHEGWCPLGEVSVCGAPSGAGKTYFALTMLEKVRKGEEVWGHRSKPREYRALLHDRSTKAMMRTVRRLNLPPESVERIIRLTPAQQLKPPAEILEAAIARNPGVEVWLIEGLDLWIPNMLKMEVLAPVIDGLQRVATRHNVCVLGTVGAPKLKGEDRYFGRDALFGSSSLARKVETVMLVSLTNREDDNSVREYSVMPRNGRAEKFYLQWEPSRGLVLTDKPETEVKESEAMRRMGMNVLTKHKPGDQVVYSPELGAKMTFYRWREVAAQDGRLVKHSGTYFVAPLEVEPSHRNEVTVVSLPLSRNGVV